MPPDLASAASDSDVLLVIVTGSGRSGTSTVSGTLKMLGTYVPQPEISPNEANPRGYFEPKWTVAYHKKVLAEAGVRTLDGRPEARELMAAVTGRVDLLDELREWFSDQLAQRGAADQVVVKDPRIVWLRSMWSSVAEDLGVQTRWLTMLRHPAEVVGSRDRHYLAGADDGRRLARETANLAGWVNVGLTNERASRGDRRVFVHYTDMISDWRASMTGAADRLGLRYDADLSSREHHPVDDFIDVSLRRVQVTLDDLDVPGNLRTIAETVWSGLDALARDPDDEDAMARLDRAREEYDQLFVHSAALVQDATDFAVQEARRKTRRNVTRTLTAQAAQADAAPPPPRPFLRRAAGRARRALLERRG
ncbi:MAG TPA: hypothetical protein VER39_12815 [Nocardioidaceae bacterium]|nr:hypothetical protein [Nocardioidaceae bacterium]